MWSSYLNIQAIDLLEQAISSKEELRWLADEVVLASLQNHALFNVAVGPELFHLALTKEFDHDVAFEGSSRAEWCH